MRFLFLKKSRDIRSKRAQKWRQKGEGLREAVVNITLATFKQRSDGQKKPPQKAETV